MGEIVVLKEAVPQNVELPVVLKVAEAHWDCERVEEGEEELRTVAVAQVL